VTLLCVAACNPKPIFQVVLLVWGHLELLCKVGRVSIRIEALLRAANLLTHEAVPHQVWATTPLFYFVVISVVEPRAFDDFRVAHAVAS